MNANSAVVEAILALPAKLDPRRAAASKALPASNRGRAPLCWRGTSIARSPPRPTGRTAESGLSKECRRRRRRPCPLCSRPMRPCANGAAAASEEIAAVRSSSSRSRVPTGRAHCRARPSARRFGLLRNRPKLHPLRARPLRPRDQVRERGRQDGLPCQGALPQSRLPGQAPLAQAHPGSDPRRPASSSFSKSGRSRSDSSPKSNRNFSVVT